MPSRSRKLIVAVASFALLAGGCSAGPEGLLGEELFQHSCAVCHGSSGEGAPARPPLNAGSDAAELNDAQIRGVLRVGPGAMPSFTNLTDEQIESLIAFLRELQGKSTAGG